jgi:hypothetical protein
MLRRRRIVVTIRTAWPRSLGEGEATIFAPEHPGRRPGIVAPALRAPVAVHLVSIYVIAHIFHPRLHPYIGGYALIPYGIKRVCR